MNEGNKIDDKGKKEPVDIIINGRSVRTYEKKLNYAEVIALAFGSYEETDSTVYTVTYSKGHTNDKGSLLPGKSVPVKKGMVFNATKTTRS